VHLITEDFEKPPLFGILYYCPRRECLSRFINNARYLKSSTINHTREKIQHKDLRKLFEQKSGEICFTDANKNFIMSHGVSSINWASFKQFLPENVYKKYMEYWKDVKKLPNPRFSNCDPIEF
jgi:hypothetical protein